MKFQHVNLGQTVLKYQVPYDIFISLNTIYQNEFKNLPPANKTLVGKIQNEHSLFYNGVDVKEIQKHNFLPYDILKWFESVYTHYLDFNYIKDYKIHLQSIWVNEMKEHEYNPVHIHQGSLYTGLSSVMILKLPQQTGEEYSASDKPMNGRLQIMGNSSGYFANTDYQPDVVERDFYVFPYDVRHSVYPFNGPGMRRTLSFNCDVEYNPVRNRSAT